MDRQRARSASGKAPPGWKLAVKPVGIICFEDGKADKSLRPDLSTLGPTPEKHREKWGTTDDN